MSKNIVIAFLLIILLLVISALFLFPLEDGGSIVNTDNGINSKEEQSAIREEMMVIVEKFGSQDTTDEERVVYANEALNLAEYTASIDVTECKLDPLISRTIIKTPIRFYNEGTAEVILYLVDDNFSVPAGEDVIMQADFGGGLGTHGYSCFFLGSEYLGMMIITPDADQ